jgi:hypothetical protein
MRYTNTYKQDEDVSNENYYEIKCVTNISNPVFGQFTPNFWLFKVNDDGNQNLE